MGDLAETIARCCPRRRDATTLRWRTGWRSACCRCAAPPADGARRAAGAWRELDPDGRFVMNKLITGAFRVGVSQRWCIRALAEVSGVEPRVVAAPPDGRLEADAGVLPRADRAPSRRPPHLSRPYPFFLAHPLRGRPGDARATSPTGRPSGSGTASARSSSAARADVRSGRAARSWSPTRFPEIVGRGARCRTAPCSTARCCAWRDGRVLPFAAAAAAHRPQDARREAARATCRSRSSPTTCWSSTARTCASGRLRERRGALEALRRRAAARAALVAARGRADAGTGSPLRAASRASAASKGLMLKRRDSRLRRRPRARRLVEVEDRSVHGRRGAGLRAARPRPARQPLHRLHVRGVGRRRAGAVRQGVLRARPTRRSARSTRGCAGNTLERFGPVRSVTPELVFELGVRGHPGVDAAQARHRGALPAHLRAGGRDKPAAEADTLDALRALAAAAEHAAA